MVDYDEPLEDLEAMLAGNIFHRAVVFGEEVTPSALEGFACWVSADGERVRSAEGFEDPATVLDRTASFLADHGGELSPGDRVIAGTLTPPLAVRPGQSVEASLGALGSVSLVFA